MQHAFPSMKPTSRPLKPHWLLLLLVGIAGVVPTGGVLVENWRGDRAWAAVERELRSRGEPLDLAAFQTPPVPDERNYFKAPLLDRLLYAKRDDPENIRILSEARFARLEVGWNFNDDIWTRYHRPGPGMLTLNDPTGDLRLAQIRLLNAQLITKPLSADPATDILLAMQPAQALLDAVRQAGAERPEAWLPLPVIPTLMPANQRSLNFGLTQGFGQIVGSQARAEFALKPPSLQFGLMTAFGHILGGRAKAELALGRADDALADVVGILGLFRAVQAAEPTPLNLLSAEDLERTAANVLTTGLLRHSWNESQLLAIAKQLSHSRSFSRLRQTLQFGRVQLNQMLDSPPVTNPLAGPNQPWPRWLIRGWAQQNKVSNSQWVEEALATFDPASGRIFPDRLKKLRQNTDLLSNSLSPFVWLTGPIVSNMSYTIAEIGVSENGLRETAAACALERYRLAHGGYPATLGELTPAFIAAVPEDVFTGQPLGYTRSPEGGFKLIAPAIIDLCNGRTWEQPGSP